MYEIDASLEYSLSEGDEIFYYLSLYKIADTSYSYLVNKSNGIPHTFSIYSPNCVKTSWIHQKDPGLEKQEVNIRSISYMFDLSEISNLTLEGEEIISVGQYDIAVYAYTTHEIFTKIIGCG